MRRCPTPSAPILWKRSGSPYVRCFGKIQPAGAFTTNLYVAVKSRAEAIWLQSGGTHGHQDADWRQAKEELGVPPEVVV